MTQNSSFGEGFDYYEALFEHDAVSVKLENEGRLELRRAGLGRHFVLMKIEWETAQADLADKVTSLRRWFEIVGVPMDAPVSITDLPRVVQIASELNQQRGKAAWQRLNKELEPPHERLSDYEGRGLARIVHILARQYGWSLQDVLELPPEAALAHVQECLLTMRNEREWMYSLSDVAWEYSKGSQSSRYKPLPPIEWDVDLGQHRAPRPISQKVRDRYFPKGVIIDLTDPNALKELGQAGSRSVNNKAP